MVDVADDEAAQMRAGKIAEACGWPHEVRRFKPPWLIATVPGVGYRIDTGPGTGTGTGPGTGAGTGAGTRCEGGDRG